MSLEWPRQKIFTSKHFNSYLGFMPFSVKHEETFSKKLRDSLMSVEIKTCSLDCDFFSTQNSTAEIDDDEEEEIWEPVGDCASDCSHINCPFRAQDDAEIFISSKTQISGSKNSLLRVVSSMSMFNATVFERTSFLTITRLVPVRDSAVIIHWSIKSTFGIRGYMVSFSKFSAQFYYILEFSGLS